jgi:UDP-N-acetylmuramyl pentapeptide phosphotransferase/UDP-N-acetylglucosamine-1-phosphate transferase
MTLHDFLTNTRPPEVLAAAAVATAAVTWLLAKGAPRLGWVDAGDGGRKTQRAPLVPVGGVALVIGCLLATLSLHATDVMHGAGIGESFSAWLTEEGLRPTSRHFLDVYCVYDPERNPAFLPYLNAGAAMLVAFLVGLVDDVKRGGLRPGAKLVGQMCAGLVLVAPWTRAAVRATATNPELGVLAAVLVVVIVAVAAAVLAQNAFNTFDNADGVASSLALVGLAPVMPLASAALAGFLPLNLRRADGRALLSRAPTAILGDAGSHLLGMLVLLTPHAWPVLALPILDLARVSLERMRAGQRPWVGDRRHLAHRLERKGAAPIPVALVLALIALPSALLGHAAGDAGFSRELALYGVLITTVLFALAVRLTRAPAPAAATAEPVDLGLEG